MNYFKLLDFDSLSMILFIYLFISFWGGKGRTSLCFFEHWADVTDSTDYVYSCSELSDPPWFIYEKMGVHSHAFWWLPACLYTCCSSLNICQIHYIFKRHFFLFSSHFNGSDGTLGHWGSYKPNKLDWCFSINQFY